ncbi:hypothetical protein HPB52_020870 [Rhipicephalus sanguineus]|uniref:CCHC-type domain-containing protein n=1 Tax=Rhipicephalus sanguineus TaxID=34632 RepID=A0A9D4Q8B9_RHISA|nr:hypothetical protein HPB52_020870 [Rhipicephalus sanguineus]
MPLEVGSVASHAVLDDNNHDTQRRQRLGSLPLLCTVSNSDNQQTTPMMLSDTEETLTATDKAATIGSSTDHNTASIPTAERTNDPQLGEGMDEHSAAFNTVMDATEDDAYNGACWKVVRNKRRARNAAALEAASLLKTDSDNPLTKPRPSGTTRLLPLPFRDEKVVLRPLGGLRLDKWPKPTLATALWAAAGVSPNALLQVQELSLGQRTYPVSSYLAAPDDSCKGIVPGLEPGTTSDTLVEEMQVTGIQILQARMMGQTNIALVTFEGFRVPRFVRFLGAELRCYPHRPRHPVCKTCLKLGHRADHCPTPDLIICEQCGIDNPMPSHPCSPRCKSCGGDHATTDPKCPRRQRQSLNRSWVKKAIDGERRQMTASTHAAPSSATTHAPETSKKSGRSRSKTRSRARSKTRTKSKSRSRSRSQSTSARIQEKRPTTPASQASPSPYKKALLSKPATSTATPEHQQPRASDNSNAMAAPREVSFEQGPAQLTPPHPPHHNTFRPSPPPNTSTDPFPEIARLRRDMEARHAQMHAQLDAAIESTNARIQAAIDNVRQESLALRKEIIAVIQASEERTHSLFAELVSRFDSVAPLPNPQAMRPQPPLTGARRTHPYSRPTTSSHDDDGVP